MSTQPRSEASSLVTAAEIAKLANVTRAAVSNWRRRYPDFPQPVGGADRNALYALVEVDDWLGRHGRGEDVSIEVLVWQALRAQYGNDIVRGLADVVELLATSSPGAAEPGLRSLVLRLADQGSPREAVRALIERFLGSSGRASSEPMSTSRLVAAVRHFAGPVVGTVFDPACGIGSLLLACADEPSITLVAQEANPAAARLSSYRAALDRKPGAKVEVGDALRDDRWPDLRADLVVCDPPVTVVDWGREDLLLDSRWEFGVPTRAESELAWVQHCFAHTAPGGRAIVVMPVSVAYRKSGRRIRAELVRRGVLTHVVALPAGMAVAHSQPVHLWLLARPVDAVSVDPTIRMIDLSDNDPDGPYEPLPEQIADVPRMDLLDEEVDLTPQRHVPASHTDHLAEYLGACDALAAALSQLRGLLPALAPGPGALDGAMVRMADLAKAGLVVIADDTVVSASDQLDTAYLDGFLRSMANIKRATSGSGSLRVDIRGSRVPQMDIDAQRSYGAAFCALAEFEQRLAELAKQGERAVSVARDGLTRGALLPES